MPPQRHVLGWDDTIKPAKPFSLSHNFNGLSLSPENKRKRRLDESDDRPPPFSVPFNGPDLASGGSGSSAPSPHSAKRSRFNTHSTRRSPATQLSVRRRLEALDRKQLMNLVSELVDQQPQLAPAVENLAPALTVASALSVLQSYLEAVEERMPYGGGRSDYAFLRVRPQWTSFFVALADYTHAFLSGAESDATRTLEYLDGATSLVHAAPVWDSAPHNALLARAYSELSDAWGAALARAQESLSYMLLTGAAWEARLQAHVERSNGRMPDTRRTEAPNTRPLVRLPETILS